MTWDKTIGSPIGMDFSTIENWADNIPDTDSGDKQMVYGRLTDEAFSKEITIDVANWTPDSSNYISLMAQSGTSFDGIPGNGPSITSGTSYTYTLTISESYTHLEKVEINNTYNGSAARVLDTGSGLQGLNFSKCLFVSINVSSQTRFYNLYTGDPTFVENCLILGGDAWMGQWAERVTFVNCVFSGGDETIVLSGSTDGGRVHIYNCVSYDQVTTTWAGGNLTATNKSHNASDSSDTDDIPGSDSVADIDSGDFNAAGSDDYHLSGTDSALYDVGVGPSTESEVPTDDIDGDTRSGTTCDIGFDEYISGGGDYTITATGGTYTKTGTAAGLLKDSKVSAGAGAYAVTGTAAGLFKGFKIAATGGAYAVTGTAVDLLRQMLVGAGSGSYALTGSDATLTYTAGYTLTAGGGSYAITGTAVDLLYNRSVVAGSGAYAVTGTSASLLYGRSLTATGGTYAVTGTATDLLYGRLISALSGTYTVTGSDVTLTYSQGALLTAGAGSYAVTGSDAALKYNRILPVDSGSYAVSGTAVDLLYNRLVTAAGGVYALTGSDVTFLVDYSITAGSGSITLTGTAVTLTYSGELVPAGIVTATFTVTTPAAGFTVTEPAVTFTAT